ncbi:hypothetical protein M0R45_000726 [Rubus argutus]|uniref:Uncharacterized protein n=1 Tax=Rubus argutus TaxID=59490 RepID=A0AAW1VKM5_RUBAR
MPISRFCFFSFKHRSNDAFNLLWRRGPSKRIQSRCYAKSSKHASGRRDISPSTPLETPTSRSRGSFFIPAAAVLGFTGLAAFFHYNDERRAVMKGQDNCSCVNNLKGPIIGGPFTLEDTENQQVQIMAKAINILESRHNLKVLPVFVTIDPQRDTPSQLRAYLNEFESKILGLTGPVTAIRQMAQEYRVFFRKIEEDGDDYLVESSHNMYLMSPNMEVVRCFGVEYNAEELSEEILKELKLREPPLKS